MMMPPCLLLLLCFATAIITAQQPATLALGDKPPRTGQNSSANYLGTCIKLWNRSGVPIRVNRFRDEDGENRRAYLDKDEEWEFCGYNDDVAPGGWKFDVMLKVSRYVPGYGWAGVQLGTPWIQVCNRCHWAKNGNMNECAWWDPERSDFRNRAGTTLGVDSSKELVVGDDNPSRGWAFRKRDRDGNKRMEYAVHHLAAACYNNMCREDWQRNIANSAY